MPHTTVAKAALVWWLAAVATAAAASEFEPLLLPGILRPDKDVNNDPITKFVFSFLLLVQ